MFHVIQWFNCLLNLFYRFWAWCEHNVRTWHSLDREIRFFNNHDVAVDISDLLWSLSNNGELVKMLIWVISFDLEVHKFVDLTFSWLLAQESVVIIILHLLCGVMPAFGRTIIVQSQIIHLEWNSLAWDVSYGIGFSHSGPGGVDTKGSKVAIDVFVCCWQLYAYVSVSVYKS